MIHIVDGNLLDATEDIIGHSVNCKGKMNSGVAKAIREKYEEAYKWYMKYVAKHDEAVENGLIVPEKILGRCQFVTVGNNKYVANLFGQFDYGYDGKQYTNVDALKRALTTLRNIAEQFNLTVALPYKIGSDRGGADWTEVYEMIDKVFEDYEVTLYRL